MRIIIPMAGTGDRYLAAGYRMPKPLIPVDGKPMIEHVTGMYPGENDFLFICNENHVRSTDLVGVLKRLKPRALIRAIPSHKKGPVYTVTQALDCVPKDDEVIVSYCDFDVSWDYRNFLQTIRTKKAQGALSAYRGFHPHSLGPTLYAYIRQKDNWLLEIKEKGHFTDNRMQEYASSGLYYFAKGAHIHQYFPLLMQKNINTNGEFYVSMIYNLMAADRLPIWIYEIEHFLQWGTPFDLQQYQYWSGYFHRLYGGRGGESQENPAGSERVYNLMLMAGLGRRFSQEGFKEPKPLITVGDQPMFVAAARCLPQAKRWGFVCLKHHLECFPLKDAVQKNFSSYDLVVLDHLTQGQAQTALAGGSYFAAQEPLLIASCDNGMKWDPMAYAKLLEDPDADAVIWTFRHHPGLERTPLAWGWVETDSGRVKRVSVKKPISSQPRQDHAVIGTFYFKEARYFVEAAAAMIKADDRVNGEFYIDQAINWLIKQGRQAVVFEVDTYLGWGTPDDWRTYNYWNNYFGKTLTKSV